MNATRQTGKPLERMRLSDSYRSARELVRMLEDGLLTVDLPYQRGPVWTEDQRIALIKSWLTGTPIASIIINDRCNSAWYAKHSHRPGIDGPVYAVIDGKQRLLTAAAWFAGELAVPASWFPAMEIVTMVTTEDGLYVTYAGLTPGMQRVLGIAEMLLPVAEAKVGSVHAEAEIYLRVNGGGTPQTAADMARATEIAEEK
jgi:Protein of unknown function DUF262